MGNEATKTILSGLQPVIEKESVAIRTFTIARNLSEVFHFAHDFVNLRRMMKHLDSLELVPPAFQFTEVLADHKLAWTAQAGSDVFAVGTVEFHPATVANRAVVRMSMKYQVTKSKIRDKINAFFGVNLEEQLIEDMRHFTQMIETGEISSTDRQPCYLCGTP